MKTTINYNNLVVNPQNFRFDPVDTEEQAIDLMLEKKGEEIFNLAKHILENGLDKAKDFRVLNLGEQQYLVLDGNRRATALKCLHDNSIIKNDGLRAKFERLLVEKTEIPQDIQTYVYSSEEEAAKWINLDHNGKNGGIGQDAWGSAEKDRFSYKFEGKLSPAMQAVNEVEEYLKVKFDTKKLKISTLNRIFSNPESRSYLGIDIQKKKLVFITDKDVAIQRLRQLFDKIINDSIAVAEVYTAAQAIKFIKTLFESLPPTPNLQLPFLNNEKDTEEGVGNIQGNASDLKNSEANTEDTSSSVYDRDSERPFESLIRSKKVPGLKSIKIKEVYKELTLILVKNCPTAVSALVRILTDLTVKEFLAKKGYKFNELGHLIVSRPENNKTTLKEVMNYVASKYIEGDLRQSVVALNSELLTQNLNQVMHNTIFSATETGIRDFWKNLKPFLEFLWKEIIRIESESN